MHLWRWFDTDVPELFHARILSNHYKKGTLAKHQHGRLRRHVWWRNYFCENCGEEVSFRISNDVPNLERRLAEALLQERPCREVQELIRSHRWCLNASKKGNWVIRFGKLKEMKLDGLEAVQVGDIHRLRCMDCNVKTAVHELVDSSGKRVSVFTPIFPNMHSCQRYRMRRALG